jgi:hypothetical protein
VAFEQRRCSCFFRLSQSLIERQRAFFNLCRNERGLAAQLHESLVIFRPLGDFALTLGCQTISLGPRAVIPSPRLA